VSISKERESPTKPVMALPRLLVLLLAILRWSWLVRVQYTVFSKSSH
jgi:hypothetical protein